MTRRSRFGDRAGAAAGAARVRVRRRSCCWLAQPTLATLAGRGGDRAASAKRCAIWAAGHLNKSREVTSSGPYRWFAHPLYVGSSIMGVGLAIASGSAIVAASDRASISSSTLTAAIKSEEAFLRRTFGDRYDRYRRGGRRRDGRDARGSASRRRSPTASTARSPGSLVAVLLLV